MSLAKPHVKCLVLSPETPTEPEISNVGLDAPRRASAKGRAAMAEQTSESKSPSPVDDQSKPGTSNEQQAPGTATEKRSRAAVWIVGGIGAALIALLVVGKSGSKQQGDQSSAAVNAVAVSDLTLQTADRNELDCMAEKGLQNYQCGAIDDKQTRQVDEGLKLRPFMSTDRQLYLIPGLFVEPAINQRYNAEPPNKPRDQLKRFTAKCKLKTLGELDNVKLRWSTSGTWEPPKKFPVATVSDCTIDG